MWPGWSICNKPFPAALTYNSEQTYHNLDPRNHPVNQRPSTSPLQNINNTLSKTRWSNANHPLNKTRSNSKPAWKANSQTANCPPYQFVHPKPFPIPIHRVLYKFSHVYPVSYPYTDMHNPAPPLSVCFHSA